MNSVFNPTLPIDKSAVLYWDGTPGCSKSVAICHAANLAEVPILLLCETNENVDQSIRELSYFSRAFENLPVFSLPDWETLPYDNFSPHQDITSERLNSLFHLPKLRRGILVLSISSLMHRLPPREYIDSISLDLCVGQLLEISQMKEEYFILKWVC